MEGNEEMMAVREESSHDGARAPSGKLKLHAGTGRRADKAMVWAVVREIARRNRPFHGR
jgi:hypothetical protein